MMTLDEKLEMLPVTVRVGQVRQFTLETSHALMYP
jgi:hypothetical protein